MTFHQKCCTCVTCAALLALGAGCSGINTSHSISPATFLLPGLLKADPPPQIESPLPAELPPPIPAAPTPEPVAATQVALAR